MGHIGHMGLSPMGQRGTLAVFNWELGTPVSVANETLNRGFPPHAVLHMLRTSGPSACLGKNLRSKVFHCAKLLDGTRDSVLALKIHAVLRGALPRTLNFDLRTPVSKANETPNLRRSRSFIIRNSSFIIVFAIHHFSKDSYCSFLKSVG